MISVVNQKLYLFLFILSGLIFSGCTFNKESSVEQINGRTMGTTYSVKLAHNLSQEQKEQLKIQIDSLLEEINQKMSTYIKDSELSLLNEAKEGWHSVSPETFSVIKEAFEISQKTSGAYDITVGPLVNLWGFGPKGEKKIPGLEEINRTKQYIGIENIELDSQNSQILKKKSQVFIDLSSIAKGYGVDRVSKFLLDIGLINHLVEIGGEIVVHGKKYDNYWRVGIEKPTSGAAQTLKSLSLVGKKAMATSGSYRNFFESKGQKYSHTIDPRTFKPVSHRLISVSVIAESCQTADAWATALMVLGPEEGTQIAQKEKLAAHFIFSTDKGIQTSETEEFRKLLK